RMEEAERVYKKVRAEASRVEAQIGVTDKSVVDQLQYARYFTVAMSTMMAKNQLRSRLRNRKFELTPIERSVRVTRSHKQLNEHASDAIKRREPNLNKLGNEYNKGCEEMAKLIKAGKAPKGAVAPIPVPAKGLYQLDVDDDIWQDVGLDGVDGDPALWLVDAKLRAGIRAMLQKDRCEEEAPRLLRERGHLQFWFAMEWKAVAN
ncbi:hypothetical protein C8R43DRAFT_867236, partial [Mycena crocata]